MENLSQQAQQVEESKVPSKYLAFLSMLVITMIIASGLLSYKVIDFAGSITMAGTIVAPILFILSDIITEVYGYKIAKNIIWFAFFCQLLFAVVVYLLIHVHSSQYNQHQQAFDFVLGSQLRITLSAFVAYIVSGMVNIYLLSKWKILVRGKHFWLRSLGSSIIGEGLFTSLAVVMIQFNKLPWHAIWQIILVSFTIKLVSLIIAVFPANLAVIVLKHVDDVKDMDFSDKFNPFRASES